MEAIARPYINVRIRQGVSPIFFTFGLVQPAYDIPATLKIERKKREREREREKKTVDKESCLSAAKRASDEIHWRLRSGVSRFFPLATILYSRHVHEIVVGEATRD
jgi:hypothetical protein